MKLIRILIFLMIFAGSLFISRNISLGIFHPQIVLETISVEEVEPKQTQPAETRQVNILIFHTASFDEPELISAWWVAITPDSPITLVNLYPNWLDNSDSAAQIKRLFYLYRDHQNLKLLNPSVLDLMNTQEIPWDGYIVLNNAGIQTLVDYLGGIQLNGVVMNGPQVISQVKANEVERNLQPEFETKLWQAICEKSLFANSPENFELVRPGLEQQSIVSPKFPLTISDYYKFNISNKSISCTTIGYKPETSASNP